MFRPRKDFIKTHARCSVGAGFGPAYECKFDWHGIFVQCGGTGSLGDGYFFEAFPDDTHVKTFIRSEATSIEAAEESAWKKYLRFDECPLEHYNPENFEAKGYENGVGFCKGCGMFKSEIIAPTQPCFKCNQKTHHGKDNQGRWWCRHCMKTMPEELMSETKRMLTRAMKEEFESPPLTDDEFKQGLTEVLEHIVTLKVEEPQK